MEANNFGAIALAHGMDQAALLQFHRNALDVAQMPIAPIIGERMPAVELVEEDEEENAMSHDIWKSDLYERKQPSEPGKQSDVVVCKACRAKNAWKSELKIVNRSVSNLVGHLKQHEEYKQKFEKVEDRSSEAVAIDRFIVRPWLSALDKKVINNVAENCTSFNSIKGRSFISLFGSTNSNEKLKGCFQHADCSVHKLNLAVKSTVSSVGSAVGECLSKCRKIAGHFSSSNLAEDLLQGIQKDAGMKDKMIKQDIITRWNSTLEKVERLVEQKDVQIYFLRHDPTEARDLTEHEWELLQQLIQLLKSADASKRDFCKDDCHLGLQIAISRMLSKEVNESVVPNLREEKNFLVKKIEEKFGRLECEIICGNYGMALFLDPRFKDRCFEDGNQFRRMVKQWLVSEYQPMEEPEEQQHLDVEAEVREPPAKKPRSVYTRQMNAIQEINVSRPTTTWEQNLEFEFVSYNAEKPVPLDSDPLIYWQKNVVSFPILSKSASRFLSAPSTSQPSEQLFSHARDVFHYKRSQLDPMNAEQLIFLNRSLPSVNFSY